MREPRGFCLADREVSRNTSVELKGWLISHSYAWQVTSMKTDKNKIMSIEATTLGAQRADNQERSQA